MKLSIKIAILLLAIAAVFRSIQVMPQREGVGKFATSPDKRYTAHAFSMTARSFWRREKHYYEFYIETEPQHFVRRVVMFPPDQVSISWRTEGEIKWEADNSSVTYTFQGTQLTLRVNP